MDKNNLKIETIISLLDLIKKYIAAPETNLIHSLFNTTEELITELDSHIQKLKMEDFSKIEDLVILFSPTSDLQEISLDSGWGKKFLEISENFDLAIKDLNEEFDLKTF